MAISSRPTLRILIADDHSAYRRVLRLLCENKGRFEVIGEAENGRQAVEQAHQLQPDVILMDIRMPVMDGITATQSIIKANPMARIIMLTAHTQDPYLFDAVKAGARGYLIKDVDPHTLIHSIQAVYRGETLLDSALTAKLFEEIRGFTLLGPLKLGQSNS
jgi:DNA-binding NarL/FixJ family response regulator